MGLIAEINRISKNDKKTTLDINFIHMNESKYIKKFTSCKTGEKGPNLSKKAKNEFFKWASPWVLIKL